MVKLVLAQLYCIGLFSAALFFSVRVSAKFLSLLTHIVLLHFFAIVATEVDPHISLPSWRALMVDCKSKRSFSRLDTFFLQSQGGDVKIPFPLMKNS